MGLQEEEDCNNTNWEWSNKIVKTQLSKDSLPKLSPLIYHLSPNI